MEDKISLMILCVALAVILIQRDVSTNGKVVIEGPRDFVTDGTRWLTLSATATNMGMSPDYAWSGLCSSNTDTCTIRPRLDQDGGTVLCAATNPDTAQSVNAQYDLHLQYPPAEAPTILKRTAGEAPSPGGNLTSGDELTCTVSGGKPLVTLVTFTCTNPYLPDQDDVIKDSSVSSSVTVVARDATEGPMVCTCFAEWSPEPSLYQKEQTMEFIVQMPLPPDERTSAASEMTSSSDEIVSTSTDRLPLQTESKKTKLAIGAGVGVPMFLILAIAVICFVCRRKKWNPCASGEQKDIEAPRHPEASDNKGAPWTPVCKETLGSRDDENTEDAQQLAEHQNLPDTKLEEEQASLATKDLGTGKATKDDKSTSSDDNTDSTYASGPNDSFNSNSFTGSDVSPCSTLSSGSNDSTMLSLKKDQSHSEENEAVQ